MIHFFFKPVKLSHLPILFRVRSLPITSTFEVLPGDSGGKETACNVGDPSSIPRLGGSPGGGSGNPLQYSCLRNFMDRGAWWATVHRVTKSWTRLSD